jgi:hypothetical protein
MTRGGRAGAKGRVGRLLAGASPTLLQPTQQPLPRCPQLAPRRATASAAGQPRTSHRNRRHCRHPPGASSLRRITSGSALSRSSSSWLSWRSASRAT